MNEWITAPLVYLPFEDAEEVSADLINCEDLSAVSCHSTSSSSRWLFTEPAGKNYNENAEPDDSTL